jgi:hypothetical protein
MQTTPFTTRRQRRGVIGSTVLAAITLTTSAMAAAPANAVDGAVVRSATGAAAADIKPAVEQFRTDLGGGNTAAANGSFGGVRREINWDGVPDAFSAPNDLPADFFNTRSPRGVVFETPGVAFQVSAKAGLSTPPRLGNIAKSYISGFSAFSEERIFTPIASTETVVKFFIPGTNKAGVVRGFGSVFTDVDHGDSTWMEFYGADNKLITKLRVPATAGTATQSFAGITLPGKARIASVKIIAGGTLLSNAALDAAHASRDKVAMDDFLYAEPEAA